MGSVPQRKTKYFKWEKGEIKKESCLGREGNTGRNLSLEADELSKMSANVSRIVQGRLAGLEPATF